jgi:hypothetical protein
MRVLFYVLLFQAAFLMAFPASVQAQDPSGDINAAIRSGDAVKLADYFDSSLDLTLPDKDQSLSKAHATQVIKKFFADYPPKSYTVNHSGSSREATKYSIGTYITGTKLFKTYVLLKKTGGEYRIVQLQFEESR